MRSIIRTLTRAGIAAGTTMLAGTLLAGALFAGPAHAEAAEPNLSFQPDILCTSSQMVYGLDVTNNGPEPVWLRVVKVTAGSGVGTDVELANGETTTFSIDTAHYGLSRLKISVDNVTLFDTGEITSTGAGSSECNLPLPAPRNDIAFDVDAVCSGITANYTVTASSSGPEAKVDLAWAHDGEVEYPTLVVNGTASYTDVLEIGDMVSFDVYDQWGRLLYSSPELIADSEGCPRSAIHLLSPKVGVECVDGSPELFVWLMNSGDYLESFDFDYQVGPESDGVGETTTNGLVPGATFETEITFGNGKALALTLSQGGVPFFVYEATAEETVCGTEDTDTPSDTTATDNGNEAPAPTTTVTPVTTVTPRSLPITGRTSTSLVIVATALLLSGLSIRLLGRRRA